jgi:hypothetical protein
MARTALAAQEIPDTGLDPVYTAANADGHSVETRTLLHVKNGSGAPINVTVVTGGTFGGKAVADTVVAVPAGDDRFIGDLRADLYAQPSGADAGHVHVDFSAVAGVTVAALKP